MKNIKINYPLIGVALALGICLVRIGIGTQEDSRTTISEILQNEDEFNLKRDSKTIIETVDVKGNYDVHIVETIDLSEIELQEMFGFRDSDRLLEKSDVEYYTSFSKDPILGYETTFYVNILTGELISVKYTDREEHWFKDDIVTSSYVIADIINEEDAYKYAYQYLGNKDSYTRDDLANMINEIKKEKSIANSSNKVMIK